MEMVQVKYNGLHDALIRMPGHYGKTKKNDIISTSKENYEKELKEQVNSNGETKFILVKKETPKEEKKESKEKE